MKGVTVLSRLSPLLDALKYTVSLAQRQLNPYINIGIKNICTLQCHVVSTNIILISHTSSILD